MSKFRIVDPNQSATKRLIAESDFIDIAEVLARAYFAHMYMRRDPSFDNYSLKPIRVVRVESGNCELEIGWVPNPRHMVGRVR